MGLLNILLALVSVIMWIMIVVKRKKTGNKPLYVRGLAACSAIIGFWVLYFVFGNAASSGCSLTAAAFCFYGVIYR